MEPAAQPGADGVEPEAHQLHHLMMELFRLIAVAMPAAHTSGAQLSLSQAFALHELDREVPLSQRDLAERLRLDKSSVSRLAAEMERDGLLVRERDPADRRLYRLRLTGRGRELHRGLGAAFHQHYLDWTSAMTEAERRALVTGLDALVRSANRSTSQTGPGHDAPAGRHDAPAGRHDAPAGRHDAPAGRREAGAGRTGRP